LVKKDLFNKEFVPEDEDDSIVSADSVKSSTLIDAPGTPSEYIRKSGYVFNPKFLKRNGYDELNDLSQLYPRTEREKWEKIGFPVK
ncbi:MAG TPA: hypothetical protein VK142_07290, partial [Bacillota bacterium]|nr:hypothetical protein [Bacillota bacterium]